MSMGDVYKTTVAEEIIGYDNGRKYVHVTVATSRADDATGNEAVDEIKVTLSKVGKISSIVPLPISMVANAAASLACNIDGKGNTVTIKVLKANADTGNLAAAATVGDLVPVSGENGVTFNFIAIGL